MPQEKPKTELDPIDVVLISSGALSAGALVAATATYRAGTRELVEDGVNPSVRLKIIPMAFKTLALSLAMTSCVGVAGFYVLKQYGFFPSLKAELPSAGEAAQMLRNPKAFVRDLVSSANNAAGPAAPAAQEAHAPTASGKAKDVSTGKG